jgi:hypothetical protein
MVKGSRHTAAARGRMSESARRANARVHDFAGKLERARALLEADPLMTTRELAQTLGVAWPTAARYRRAVEGAVRPQE